MKKTAIDFRYPKAVVSGFHVNHIHLRNPNMIMWWSAAFPGFGHIMLCKYILGSLLIGWEFLINVNAHLNEAIYLSFIGEFEQAKQVLDTRWLLVYAAVYLFTIWDSRRVAIDLNKFALLADREGSTYRPFHLTPLEVSYLDRIKPKWAVIWSFLLPGVGHLYINRMLSSVLVIVWWTVSLYFSKFLLGLHLTMTGDFEAAKQVLDPQWLLFLPSMYGFAAYDAYTNAIEYNKLFKREQGWYLAAAYQEGELNLPPGKSGQQGGIQVVASFESTMYVQLALTDLEQNGISKTNIFAVPLVNQVQEKDSLQVIRGSGYSSLDGAFALGTAMMVLGVIYGYKLTWGPILWGLIGLAAGCAIGYALDYLRNRHKLKKKQKNDDIAEIFVVISCQQEQYKMVEQVLWNHFARGVAKIET